MGYTAFSSTAYKSSVEDLYRTASAFARSTAVRASGNYTNISGILNPSCMVNNSRECCFAPNFTDALGIVVAIDCTGSMQQVPYHLQKELPTMIDVLVEQSITDHPNICFMGFDDYTVTKNAAFQMSQFESGNNELITALNELVIPGAGGFNDSESYHLAFYAAGNHTRLESLERDNVKGIFFLVCDELPFYSRKDPNTFGTPSSLITEVFGTSGLQEESMIESMRKTLAMYDVFIIRPRETSNGSNHTITVAWQNIVREAGGNVQNVLEIETMDQIIPTMVMSIGQLYGENSDNLVSVLKKRGINDLGSIVRATHEIVPYRNTSSLTTSTIIDTGSRTGRQRVSR